jgi:hypothetical protein
MDARTGTITLPQRADTRLPWAVAIFEALLIAALLVAILVVKEGSPSTTANPGFVPQVLSHEAAVQFVGSDYAQYGITGTGPALSLVGTWSQPAAAVPVTGTGPGLVHVAGGPTTCHPGWCPPALQR